MSVGNLGTRQAGPTVTVDGDAANRTPWGYMQFVCNGVRFADAQQTVGYVEINAGAKNPRHLHPNSDEVLYLIAGELDHSLGDATVHLTPGMAIHIPQGVPHDAHNRGNETARMIVSYPTTDRQVVMLEAGQE